MDVVLIQHDPVDKKFHIFWLLFLVITFEREKLTTAPRRDRFRAHGLPVVDCTRFGCFYDGK